MLHLYFFFFFNDTATTEIYTLSLHDALPIFSCLQILEAFLWFVLITLLNVTLIILTLSVSRLKVKIISVTFRRVRSEERFSRNAETDLVCRLLLEKKKIQEHTKKDAADARLKLIRCI